MAKSANTLVLDALLDAVATATHISACSQEPTTRAHADATYALAKAAISGSFTKAAAGSGRKTTIPAQSTMSITTNGTATHIALYTGTQLIYVTTCASQALVSGGTLNLGAWEISVGQPT